MIDPITAAWIVADDAADALDEHLLAVHAASDSPWPGDADPNCPECVTLNDAYEDALRGVDRS